MLSTEEMFGHKVLFVRKLCGISVGQLPRSCLAEIFQQKLINNNWRRLIINVSNKNAKAYPAHIAFLYNVTEYLGESESVAQRIHTISCPFLFGHFFYRQKCISEWFHFENGNDPSCHPTNIVVPVWWQVYQLQTELQKAQIENEFQKRRSLRSDPYADTQLQEEVRSLRCQLVKAEKLDPVRTTTSSFCLFG